jgi:MoaA/NifB/PqqE/SkfB family radical SAM enzyme
MTQKTFCVNPWISVNYRFGKGFNPCCVFDRAIEADSTKDYAASTELANIKQQLIDGKQIPECNSCWAEERNGFSSKRIRDNKRYQQIVDAKFGSSLKQPTDNFVYYHVRLGNHCNLRCFTCSDEFSTGWISENKKFGLPHREPILIKQDEPIWQELRDNAAHIGRIEFVGGEPFMMLAEEQASLFKYLVESGHSKHIRLMYNTNCTRMPAEQIDYWQYFNSVDLNLSIDGVGKQFEYLRFPADWNAVKDNIKQYMSMPKANPTIVHTIIILNVGYLPAMLDFCKEQGITLFVNPLHYPSVLDIGHAPAPVREWIKQQLHSVDHPDVKNILSMLDNNDYHSSTEILDYCNTLDQRRGTSLADTFPELVQALHVPS